MNLPNHSVYTWKMENLITTDALCFVISDIDEELAIEMKENAFKFHRNAQIHVHSTIVNVNPFAILSFSVKVKSNDV